MMSSQQEVKKEGKKKTNGCRQIHFSIHSPHLELEFCKNCDAYVQAIEGNKCSCCKKQLVKFLKHTWLSRVLKFGVRQHHNFLRDWAMFPMDCINVENLDRIKRTHDISGNKINVKEIFERGKKACMVMLEIKYRDTVYEIPAKWLALALEPIEEEAKLELIKRHVSIKGLRIWIPDDEQTDVKCTRCDTFLRYKADKIFCPKCSS